MFDETVAEPDELGAPAWPAGPAQPQSVQTAFDDPRGRGVIIVEVAVEGDVPEAAAKVAVVGLVPRFEVPRCNLSW